MIWCGDSEATLRATELYVHLVPYVCEVLGLQNAVADHPQESFFLLARTGPTGSVLRS